MDGAETAARGALSKSQAAYAVIKEMILTGELAPLDDVSEKRLQEQLGISRTPIHEAVKRLEEERFVRTYPQKGTFVEDVTMETVRYGYEFRLLVEPYMTRQAVGVLPEAQLRNMYRRLTDYPPMEQEAEILYLMELDAELHAAVAHSTENIFLRDAIRNVYDHDRRIRLKTKVSYRQVRFSRLEHIAILDAMLEGDRDLAERRDREHIVNSRDLTYWTLGFRPSISGELEERLAAV